MKKINRKEFLSYTAMASAAGVLGSAAPILTSCASSDGTSGDGSYTPLKSDIEYHIADCGDKAIDGKPIRAGIIGCGSRGSGAANDFLNAGDGLSITAMADIFPDKIEYLYNMLKERGNEVDKKNIFCGFDAYKQMIDSCDIDMVIVTTPTLFHPTHTKYAIDAGKHVFCEKPAAIDAVGARTYLAAIKQAQAKGLCIVTGTQRHHNRDYVESYKKVRSGMIGEITGGAVYWNQGGPWFAIRKPEWTDMEYMFRDFFSWNWLCGDHIIDQMVHNMDVFCWFSHLKPVSVVGMGSRLRRTTGDIFDNFSCDFVFENDVHVQGMCRQIDGCANNVSEFIQGTKGSWTSQGGHKIMDLTGKVIWEYDYEAEKATYKQNNAYVLEHMNLVNHIRRGEVINLAECTVLSSVACAMGRESAYTGREMKWDEFIASDLNLMPEKLHLGNVGMENYPVPVPGTAQK